MKCPVCEVDLQMSERQGIEIDYCPKCRGVWLDRGELDKIIERTNAEFGPGRGSRGEGPRREEQRHDHHDERRSSEHHDRHDDHKHKKKKSPSSFLGDIFDL
jgi:Zn-finger nucleic acid-binding protein